MRALAPALACLVLLAGCGGSPDTPAAVPVASTAPASALAAGSGDGLSPQGRTISDVPVDRVVDGDTITADVDGQEVRVRMIGINAPESVKPDSPVECFGPEASDFAKEELTGATVTLELDDSQGATDQYGRTLAYVWIQGDGGLRLFNREAVAAGYVFERQYGPVPYAWKDEFRQAQREAKGAARGLWGACDYS